MLSESLVCFINSVTQPEIQLLPYFMLIRVHEVILLEKIINCSSRRISTLYFWRKLLRIPLYKSSRSPPISNICARCLFELALVICPFASICSCLNVSLVCSSLRSLLGVVT